MENTNFTSEAYFFFQGSCYITYLQASVFSDMETKRIDYSVYIGSLFFPVRELHEHSTLQFLS